MSIFFLPSLRADDVAAFVSPDLDQRLGEAKLLPALRIPQPQRAALILRRRGSELRLVQAVAGVLQIACVVVDLCHDRVISPFQEQSA